MGLFKRLENKLPSHAPYYPGELVQANERLQDDNRNQKELLEVLGSRLQAAIARAEKAESELRKTRVELEIERTISKTDRMGEAREALNKMSGLVRIAQEERDKAHRRLSQLANERPLEIKEPAPRKPKPGRVPFEWRDTRTITSAMRKSIYDRDGGKCRYCGVEVNIGDAHIDHVYPHSQGGKTIPENLVLSCLVCNMDKVDRIGIWPRPLPQEMQL